MPPTLKRGLSAHDPKDNVFRRLVSACGMTGAEAAQYLGLAEQTAHQKMLGRRGTSEAEETALVELWGKVRKNQPRLDDTYPLGARFQQHAIWEADRLLHGLDPSDGAFRHSDSYRDDRHGDGGDEQ